jgi:hypothetical protein
MIPVIASVAVFTDEPSAAMLSGLPGLELDPAAVRRVLDDPDPVAAGIAAAASEARALLDIPGVAGGEHFRRRVGPRLRVRRSGQGRRGGAHPGRARP